MIEVKAPGDIPSDPLIKIFLAGSIEMGAAVDWQKEITKSLSDLDCVVLNPRRDDWDPSWEQTIDNPEFNQQVNWELDGIEQADIVVFYFDPATKSPITLMELGLLSSCEPWRGIVCCPQGFWRKGNVDILCQRNEITQVDTLAALVTKVKRVYSTLI